MFSMRRMRLCERLSLFMDWQAMRNNNENPSPRGEIAVQTPRVYHNVRGEGGGPVLVKQLVDQRLRDGAKRHPSANLESPRLPGCGGSFASFHSLLSFEKSFVCFMFQPKSNSRMLRF